MPYNVNSLDLAPGDGAVNTIAGRGDTVSELATLALPDGASFQVRFGSQDWITIAAPFTMKPVGSDRTAGLQWRNTNAQPGVKVELIVSRDDGTGAADGLGALLA